MRNTNGPGWHTILLCGLSPRALDDCVESLVSNTDCQQLSLAMIVISSGRHAVYLQHRTTSSQDGHRLRKFTNSVLVTDFEREHRNNSSHSHTGGGRLSSKQSLTPYQLYPVMRRIYQRLGRSSGSVILFFSYSVHRAVGSSLLLLATFAKG